MIPPYLRHLCLSRCSYPAGAPGPAAGACPPRPFGSGWSARRRSIFPSEENHRCLLNLARLVLASWRKRGLATVLARSAQPPDRTHPSPGRRELPRQGPPREGHLSRQCAARASMVSAIFLADERARAIRAKFLAGEFEPGRRTVPPKQGVARAVR